MLLPFEACISSRITTVIHVSYHSLLHRRCCIEPFAVSLKEFTLILAWLSLGNKHMELAGSTRYRWVYTTAEDFVETTLRGYSPCLSAERVPETPVNFTSLSSQELVSLLQPRSLPSGVALLLRVSS